MIDQAEFAKWMGIIADRCNRPLHPATAVAYYDALSRQLDTEQFVVAAQLVFEEETWWPAPAAFIAKARPNVGPRLEAQEAFDKVVSITARGGSTPEIKDKLGQVALRAYWAVGGYARFKNLLEVDEKWVRKEFVEAYEDAWKLAARDAEILQLRADRQKQLGEKAPKQLTGAPMTVGEVLTQATAKAAS